MKKIELLALQGIPRIKEGDELAKIIVRCALDEIGPLKDKDIIVITSKIVSKAAGMTRKLSEVKPGRKARTISAKTGKDARWLQMTFEQGHQILAIVPLKGAIVRYILKASGPDEQCARRLIEHEQALCITRSTDGRIHTCDAGIDGSNHPEGIVSFMPPEPDEAAEAVREEIKSATGKEVAVILADTELMPFGTMDFAVGSSGIEPRSKEFGKADKFVMPKIGGMDLTAHQLTAAAALHFGQVDAGIPVAVVRGYEYNITNTENIANTLWPGGDKHQARRAIKEIIGATAGARPFKQRLLLKIASRFV